MVTKVGNDLYFTLNKKHLFVSVLPIYNH